MYLSAADSFRSPVLLVQGPNGIVKDMKLAVAEYERANAQGFVAAQCALGLCHLAKSHLATTIASDSRGVAKDFAKGVELLQAAAAQGNVAALFYLGWCYEHARGVERDETRAVANYQVCIQGTVSVFNPCLI